MSGASVKIHFEGRILDCRPDVTVAVALWENGVRVLSHSPKYGRPRGLGCARGHCTNCLMRIDGVPNVRACSTPVRDGMTVARQDGGAFYARPMQKSLELGGGLFPVGFYYKWFTRPAAVSHLFMRAIRPLAGVGRLPDPAVIAGDRDAVAADAGPVSPLEACRVEHVVVGGGAAGMAEALRAGGEVLLVDDMDAPGGQRKAALDVVAEAGILDAFPLLSAARARLDALAAEVAAKGVKTALGTQVVGAFQPDMLLLHDGKELSVVRGDTICWAAGAFDALGVFDDNDRPGLCGPRAAYRLLALQNMDVRGRRAVVCGEGLDLWLAAALLHARGARVSVSSTAGCDLDARAVEAGAGLGWTLHTGLEITGTRAADGVLAGIELAAGGGGARTEIPCELAVVAGRGKPAYDVPYQLGADQVLDPARGGYVPRAVSGGRAEGETAGGLRLVVAGEAAGETPAAVLNVAQEVDAR